jgi:hypothetical protein
LVLAKTRAENVRLSEVNPRKDVSTRMERQGGGGRGGSIAFFVAVYDMERTYMGTSGEEMERRKESTC